MEKYKIETFQQLSKCPAAYQEELLEHINTMWKFHKENPGSKMTHPYIELFDAEKREIVGICHDERAREDMEKLLDPKTAAFKLFFKTIKEDRELFQGYKANIVMAFQDEYNRSEVKDIHEISNNAAEHFLNLLALDVI